MPVRAVQTAGRFQGGKMKDPVDRRTFMKIAGTSIGVGALFTVAPLLGASPAGRRIAALLGKKNGEAPTPFSFVQPPLVGVNVQEARAPWTKRPRILVKRSA